MIENFIRTEPDKSLTFIIKRKTRFDYISFYLILSNCFLNKIVFQKYSVADTIIAH